MVSYSGGPDTPTSKKCFVEVIHDKCDHKMTQSFHTKEILLSDLFSLSLKICFAGLLVMQQNKKIPVLGNFLFCS